MKTSKNIDVASRSLPFLRKARRVAIVAAAVGYSTCAMLVSAAPLNITDVPLFLNITVKPNLIMAVDDSGSMGNEVLLPTNDGAAWWRFDGQASDGCLNNVDDGSFVGCVSDGAADIPAPGMLNVNNDGNAGGAWKKFTYLFPNGCCGTTTDRRTYGDGSGHYAIAPTPQLAWARSVQFNPAYFDPTVTYTPWQNADATFMADSPPAAAPFDPLRGGHGPINLTQDFAGVGNVDPANACVNASMPGIANDYYFTVQRGMTIPANACVRRSGASGTWLAGWAVVTNATCQVGVTAACTVSFNAAAPVAATLPDGSQIAVRYFPATFFASAANAPPATFGFRPSAVVTDGLAPNGTVLNRYEIKPGNFDETTYPGSYAAAMQNFANWFTYYRKRHQALRGGFGKAFSTVTAMRIDGFTINNSGHNSAMLDMSNPVDKASLYSQFYSWVGDGGTPNRNGVANIVRNFKRTNAGAPVTHECQRNFGMLFTDGYSNQPSAGDGITAANVDGGDGAPYADTIGNTLADHVMDAYKNSIRPLLPQGKVSVPSACSLGGISALDCNTNPHMNFYAITLGARGLQYNPDVLTDPYVTAPTWPTVFPARHPSAVDDLWHATINGRGQLLTAKRPSELTEKLVSVLDSITAAQGSAASASVNSGSISTDTLLFQSRFGTTNWTGDLLATKILPGGALATTDVSATFSAPGSRNIVAVNASGAAVPFRLANLDATRIGQLGATLTERTDVLNYLRGDRSLERQNGGPYRVRGGVLGDVVSSAPFYVAAPLFRYSDSIAPAPYSAFVAANSGRQPMVYVGANDGMLHAFSVDSSGAGAVAEEFAFIPSPVFRNMKNLTDINYTHQFYVDGTPTVVDAYLEDLGGTPASKWRTVLVGGLGKGGQGVYALDVTNPANLTESQASNIKLWEFTDADDADLGYTYSRPAIVKLHNGKWAAVFGNGYNNTASPAGDTHVSSTGNAALYFVNIATGALMKKITVPVGMAQDPLSQSRPNGLGTPAMVDIDGDRVVDRAYVGDIFGNMWKFDLTDVNEVNWDVAMTDAVSGAPIPLFVARNAAGGVQPITTRPQVTRAPKGRGMIILFGTGKFMEAIDRDPASVVPQSFYGLYDNGEATTIARTSLLQQTILAEVSSDPDGDGNFTRFRVTSNNPLLSNQKGWYMNLLAPPNVFEGEMQVTDPGLRNGRVVFTTLIPDPNPCSKGGKSWVLDLNAYTGSRSAFTPADINGDRLFNTADFLTIGGVGTVAISGIGDNNISSAFRFISGGADDPSDYGIGTTTGGTANVFRFNPGPGAVGRQSWRQLR